MLKTYDLALTVTVKNEPHRLYKLQQQLLVHSVTLAVLLVININQGGSLSVAAQLSKPGNCKLTLYSSPRATIVCGPGRRRQRGLEIRNITMIEILIRAPGCSVGRTSDSGSKSPGIKTRAEHLVVGSDST